MEGLRLVIAGKPEGKAIPLHDRHVWVNGISLPSPSEGPDLIGVVSFAIGIGAGGSTTVTSAPAVGSHPPNATSVGKWEAVARARVCAYRVSLRFP